MTATGADIYAKMGARAVINAQGNRTVLGGSATVPEVTDAMAAVNDTYVEMAELLARSGEYIADLLGVEAAYVTIRLLRGPRLQRRRVHDRPRPRQDSPHPRYDGHEERDNHPEGPALQATTAASHGPRRKARGGRRRRRLHGRPARREDRPPTRPPSAYLVRPGDPDSVLALEQAVEIAHSAGIPAIAGRRGPDIPRRILPPKRSGRRPRLLRRQVHGRSPVLRIRVRQERPGGRRVGPRVSSPSRKTAACPSVAP